MSTTTMNISLPEALKRFVKERTKAAHYSNPSDYVRALIREDQRRQAAERLLDGMLSEYLAANPASAPEKINQLRAEYWARWNELKAALDAGVASLDRGEGKALDIEDIIRLARSGTEVAEAERTEMLASLKQGEADIAAGRATRLEVGETESWLNGRLNRARAKKHHGA